MTDPENGETEPRDTCERYEDWLDNLDRLDGQRAT